MYKALSFLIGLGLSGLALSNLALATPNMTDILRLNNSIVLVIVDTTKGDLGSGSGVVVSPNFVATDCHVLVNSRGVAINKYGDNYQPVAIRADWKHDLCLLRFDKPIPFTPLPMVESSKLQYEQEVFTLTYPNDAQVPQPSYGQIKALYPYDGSHIIRTSTPFALGSSGGALFDESFNLIGITTFKSPGRHAYFYSLPVEWIKQLMEAEDVKALNSDVAPFWSYPDKERPFFMQVALPTLNEKWDALQDVAQAWLKVESNNAEPWFYLGLAELNQQHPDEAKAHFMKAIGLNDHHAGAYKQLALMALAQHDQASYERYKHAMEAFAPMEVEVMEEDLAKSAQANISKVDASKPSLQ